MDSRDSPNDGTNRFSESRFGSEAVARLRAAFARSRNPMLIADDRRRWVTANAAACSLLGVVQEDIPWLTIDDLTPPQQRERLQSRWKEFLASGAAEGWYQLYIPGRGILAAEFSATANVLPARHLSVFIPPEGTAPEPADRPLIKAAAWTPVEPDASGRPRLTEREREVMTLVAAGHQNAEIARRLFLSPDTIKSHVKNAMGKLDSHTRAHAVAVALVSGQITWKT